MKRVDEFTEDDVAGLRAFALELGLGFARDLRADDGVRRSCIHECGHALMYVLLGVKEWRIEFDERGPETFLPPTALEPEAYILMALGGPLAEEKLCGPKGVFRGALDDIWQVKECAEGLGLSAVKLRPLLAQAREVLREHRLVVIEMAEHLQKNRRLSSGDLFDDDSVLATSSSSVLLSTAVDGERLTDAALRHAGQCAR